MGPTPTVYFIDDSATMREVIKIAFRRENINVVAYNDAASALGQIESARPDVVISDVIMPDKDGYEVCQFIKQHASLGKTPVILMSGVVNRAVAEKAFAVKADELIRKPFQPQDLITRVKHLLTPNAAAQPQAVAAAAATSAPINAAAALSSIFQTPAKPVAMSASVPAAAHFTQAQVPSAARAAAPAMQEAPAQYAAPVAASRPAAAAPAATGGMTDMQKVRMEIQRLEGLVRKLQSELQAEREYTRSLEEHLKTLQEQ